VTGVEWDPDDGKPADASSLEDEIGRVAPGARVKLTLRNGRWLVRALAPGAMCARGTALSGRDVSDAVAQILTDHDHPATVRR
jgi:hypothetical protein